MSKGNPLLAFRVSRKENLALRLLAKNDGTSIAVYLHEVVKQHLENIAKGVNTHSMGEYTPLENLVRMTKEHIVRVRLARDLPVKVPMKDSKEAGLPGTEKRGCFLTETSGQEGAHLHCWRPHARPYRSRYFE